VVAALGVLLAACGGEPGGPVGDDSSAEGGGATGTGPRTVEHALGSTEVPAAPARVVTLSSLYAVNLLSLGLVPVAAGDQTQVQLEQVAELLPPDVDPAAIPSVGEDYAPDVEAVAAADPDLVIGDEFHGDLYDQLSGAAPTVLVEYRSNGGWRERFLDVAEAVGRSEEADRVEAEYEEFVAELPEDLGDTRVAFVRSDPDGSFRIDSGEAAFPGSVAADAGIPVVTGGDGVGEFDEGSGFVTVSGERLDAIADADLVVVADFSALGDEATGVAGFESNPLWSTLPAVQSGDVLEVPGLVYNGGTHYSAQLLLEAVAEAVS
jgi:iron complex transport system substrate-binding protein